MKLPSPLRRSKSIKLQRQRHQTTSRRVTPTVLTCCHVHYSTHSWDPTRLDAAAHRLWRGFFRYPLHLDPPCSATHSKCVHGVVTWCHPVSPSVHTYGKDVALHHARTVISTREAIRSALEWSYIAHHSQLGLWRIITGMSEAPQHAIRISIRTSLVRHRRPSKPPRMTTPPRALDIAVIK